MFIFHSNFICIVKNLKKKMKKNYERVKHRSLNFPKKNRFEEKLIFKLNTAFMLLKKASLHSDLHILFFADFL